MRGVTLIHRRSFLLRLGAGWSYAEKGGGPCLKGDTSWRKINGVWINTPWWNLWLEFRRF